MKALIQRVSEARVEVQGETVGEIGPGLLLLLGVDAEDTQKSAEALVHKVINYRVFSDSDGKMNLSLVDTSGGILVVSQFTLSADTSKGRRPSFTRGAPPELAEQLYEYFVDQCRQQLQQVETGIFAADMQVSLTNDGPVTFLLEV